MLTRRRLLTASLAVPLAAALIPSVPRRALAAEPENFAVDGMAIRGIDPLGYFTAGAPVAGSAAHALIWRGAIWYFADAGAMTAFEGDPEAYCPVFGGYCAYAASLGYLAPSVPEAWTVHDGRLYLNASLRARELWLGDIDGNIAKGRANWPDILG